MDKPYVVIPANNAIRGLFAIIGATKQLPTVEFLPKDGNTLIGFLSEDKVFEVYTTTKIVVPKPMATTPAGARATHWRTLKEIEFYHDGIVFVFPDGVERFKYETPLQLNYTIIEDVATRNDPITLDAKKLRAVEDFLKRAGKAGAKSVYIGFKKAQLAYQVGETTNVEVLDLGQELRNDRIAVAYGVRYLFPIIHEIRMLGPTTVKFYPFAEEGPLFIEARFKDGSELKVAIAPRTHDEDNPMKVFYKQRGYFPASMEELKELYKESIHEVNKVFGELKERIKEVEELYNKVVPKLEELYKASPPRAWPKFSNLISVEHTLRQLKIDKYKIDDLRKSLYWLSKELDKCEWMLDPKGARACAENMAYNYLKEADKLLRELKAWEEFIGLPGKNYAEKLKNLGDRIVGLLVERCGHARDMGEMARCAGEDEEIKHLMWVLNVANAATGTEDMYEMALEKAKRQTEKPAKVEVIHNSPVGWERVFKLAWEDLSPKEKNIFVALFGDIDSFLFAVRNSDEDEGTQRALTTIFEAMKNHKIDELYREFEQAIVKNPQLPPAKIIKNVLGGEFIPKGLLAFIQSYKSSLHLPASLEIALRRAGMLNKVGKAYRVSNLDVRQFVNFFEWLITAERRGIRGDVEVTPEGLLWISADKTIVLLVRANTHLAESHSLDLASIADVLVSDSLSKRFVEDLHHAWFYMLFDKGGHFIGIAILSRNNAYIVSAEPLELRLEPPRPNLNDMSNLRIGGNDIKVVTKYLHYKPTIFVSTHLGRGEKGFVADIWRTKKGYNVKEFEVGVVATPRESALYSTALSWVAGEVMRWWQGAGGVAIYSKGWFNHTYIFPVTSYGALGDDFMIYATPDVSVEEFVRERWFAKKPKAGGAEKPAEEKP
ncbi:MAG: hypothetical protein J7K48_08100, partial [Thermococcus sp.]|nr:hypothetical protein [Thermococcus sp.]